jgi:hypothetical protein
MAGAAVAASPVAYAAPTAATPQWRIAYRSSSGILFGVTALSRTNAWAVGAQVILHWQGTRWQPVKVPGITSRYLPTAVAASSPNNVWIFGQGATQPGEAHVWNGKAWQTLSLPDSFALRSAAVFSPSNVWSLSAGATDFCPSLPSRLRTCLFHWNGQSWNETEMAGRTTVGFASAGSHAWYLTTSSMNPAGDSSLLAVYETTGSGLRRIPGPNVTLGSEIGLAAAPNGQLWVSGRMPRGSQPPVLFHWTGAKWVRIAVPGAFDSFYAEPLVFDGKTGVWYSPFAHWTGTRWINTNTSPVLNADADPFDAMTAIPGSASAWAVGGYTSSGPRSTIVGVYGPLP